MLNTGVPSTGVLYSSVCSGVRSHRIIDQTVSSLRAPVLYAYENWMKHSSPKEDVVAVVHGILWVKWKIPIDFGRVISLARVASGVFGLGLSYNAPSDKHLLIVVSLKSSNIPSSLVRQAKFFVTHSPARVYSVERACVMVQAWWAVLATTGEESTRTLRIFVAKTNRLVLTGNKRYPLWVSRSNTLNQVADHGGGKCRALRQSGVKIICRQDYVFGGDVLLGGVPCGACACSHELRACALLGVVYPVSVLYYS